MRFVMFYHSLVSDWNHGNAHFLRGIATELLSRGHDVSIFEPADGWSYSNLIAAHGKEPLCEFQIRYPPLSSHTYQPDSVDLDAMLDGADVVLVHEWTEPEVIAKIGRHHRDGGRYKLLFHDTHHRTVSDPRSIGLQALQDYDGVLAFGESLRRLYSRNGWANSVWAWHEAADTRVFQPIESQCKAGDVVWVGNWGDDERTAELDEFLFAPVRALRLRARVHGVRYPDSALKLLAESGVEYAGWLPNFRVPEVFGAFRITVHIPRRPYREMLPGIPTIRVFEALACGVPLICAPWDDCENLFTPGRDYLVANNRAEMMDHLRTLMESPEMCRTLSEHALKTIHSRHTCGHRTDQLLEIVAQ